MCAWALSVLDELTPQLWGSAINYVSRAPQELLDEVRGLVIVHGC